MNMDVKQVNPFALPSVSIQDLGNLPNASGIYFAIAESTTDPAKILYVGKATSFFQRWKNHHRFNEINAYQGVKIAWLSYVAHSEEELSDLERACITQFMPFLNSTAVPNGLIKASYYITEAQNLKLEQIRYARKLRGVKVDKSALIREAIDLLSD